MDSWTTDLTLNVDKFKYAVAAENHFKLHYSHFVINVQNIFWR